MFGRLEYKNIDNIYKHTALDWKMVLVPSSKLQICYIKQKICNMKTNIEPKTAAFCIIFGIVEQILFFEIEMTKIDFPALKIFFGVKHHVFR